MTDRHAAYPTGLRDAQTRHRALRQRMAAPGIVVAPGAYDCITAAWSRSRGSMRSTSRAPACR
jgi:2-methylisocitrate lyase-like PEP mutase family enzyme